VVKQSFGRLESDNITSWNH